MTECNVCFRHCRIEEGKTGFCGARICRNGKVIAGNYGKITSLALDPIEKKPLSRFFPGSLILSVGSYGCNLRCPFCQNYEISWSEQAMRYSKTGDDISPEELAYTAAYYQDRGNIGVAFTYNEPLIGYEYVRDTAKLVHEMGMKNVLVSNGTASLSVLEELAPYIDAMNIDLKGFTDRYYRDVLKGDRNMVMDFIAAAVKTCHVELTTLIVPGENDGDREMEELAEWIARLETGSVAETVYAPETGSVAETVYAPETGMAAEVGCVTGSARPQSGRDIPLHISRFFPRFQMQDRAATPIKDVYHLAEVARRHLNYVYTGNC